MILNTGRWIKSAQACEENDGNERNMKNLIKAEEEKMVFGTACQFDLGPILNIVGNPYKHDE